MKKDDEHRAIGGALLSPAIYEGFPLKAGMIRASGAAGSGNAEYSFASLPQHKREKNSLARLAAFLEVEEHNVQCMRQIHSDTIVEVRKPILPPPTADALITNVPHIVLVALTADCLPVLIYDPVQHCAAAIHSGWRGTAADITAKTIDELSHRYHSKPADLLVWCGVGITAQNYEVGQEFSQIFEGKYLKKSNINKEKYIFDNAAVVVDSLLSKGVERSSIEVQEDCSYSSPAYHSFRRDGVNAGRMATFIALF